MIIDYITAHDPNDIRTWSGLNYFIMKALEAQGAKINIITGLHAKPDFGLKLRWHWHNLLGKNYPYERTHCYTRQFGNQVNGKLSPDADCIFSTTSSALAYIKSKKPVFLYTDATFNNLAEYYLHFSRLPRTCKRQGDDVEVMAMNNCSHLFYASEWAAQSAIEFYRQERDKVTVVPFGANLMELPFSEGISKAKVHKPQSPLNILLVGVDFEQKGVDIAIEAVTLLNERGFCCTLHVVGIKSWPQDVNAPYLINHGFLDKQDPSDLSAINNLYREADLFLLPTRLECFGVVFAEAAAYGLPVISTNTGGVSGAVIHGETGFLIPKSTATAEQFAHFLEKLATDQLLYQEMGSNALNQSKTVLNWEVSGEILFKKMHQFLSK